MIKDWLKKRLDKGVMFKIKIGKVFNPANHTFASWKEVRGRFLQSLNKGKEKKK